MKEILTSRRGEMYIEAVITLIVVIAFLLFALSLFQVASVKNTADTIADQLLETAAFYGGFGPEFDEKVAELHDTFSGLPFEVTYDGEWYNQTLERVQLGDSLSVTVHYEVRFGGFGVFVTVPLSSVRTGASENYWKTA